MSDEDSNFKSAIEWPEDRPEKPESDTRFKPMVLGLATAFDHITERVEGSESPIEQWLGSGLALYLAKRVGDKGATFAIAPPRSNGRPAHFVLIPQFEIGRSRYDLALAIAGEEKPILLIECDSKEFHSSEEQLENDRLKDALAKAEDIELVRVTGGAIHYEYEKCVKDIVREFVRQSFRRAKKDFRWLESER